MGNTRTLCQKRAYSKAPSPRVWGKQFRHKFISKRCWFIPTYVGNTRRSGVKDIVFLVHPHVCGEYYNSQRNDFHPHGSSPRVWGILCLNALPDCSLWFIPTCVGNTTTVKETTFTLMVHPHVCGEYSLASSSSFIAVGSSPRVWGILMVLKMRKAIFWFIPTCVGNTIFSSLTLSILMVHPHVCGEYFV